MIPMTKPTAKQIDFINSIEDLTGIPFTGSTKQEATRYISENIDEFRRREELEGLAYALQHENAGDRV